MDYEKTLYNLKLTPYKYIKRIVIPSIVGGIVFVILLNYLFPQAFVGVTFALIYIIPFFCLLFALIYPSLMMENKKIDIDKNIHFFISNIVVLSTSEIPRKDIFKTISQKPEYGELAKECGVLYMMVDTWHISLAEACRFLAKYTPSSIFSDFLERLAQAMDSGQKLEDFLMSEQGVVMKNYEVMYHGALYEIDLMKEILTSFVITLVFIMSFAIIMPFITGQDIVQLIVISLFVFIFSEIIIVYMIRTKVPHDNIWHSINIKTKVDEKLKFLFISSIFFCIILLILILSFGNNLPLPIKTALFFTPLLIIGFFARKEEELIKRRDENYAEFIRSLGASTDSRGGLIEDALKYISLHDFGVLSMNIRNLYKRLRTRIGKMDSWRYFESECGSNLIQHFTEMFVEALHIGGKPLPIARCISDNFIRIQALRKQRYQNTSSFIGIMYGLQAGIAFSIYISFGVVKMINSIFTKVDVPDIASSFLYTFEPSSLAIIPFLLISVIVVHALISAISIRIVDGGHMLNTFIHFVGIVWMGAITAVITESMLSSLLSI